MKKRIGIYLLVAALSAATTSCIKAPGAKEPEQQKEYFDFATIGNYGLSIDYKLKFNSVIVFWVYDEYPFKKSDIDPELEILNESLKPVLKGITQNYGKYSGILSLKKSVKQIFIYSTTIGVPQLLKSQITNNSFSVDATNPVNFTDAGVAKSYSQNAIIDGRYHSLGAWDVNGLPNYLLAPDIVLSASLIDDINASLPEAVAVPKANPHYIANGVQSALHIIDNAKIEVVFVHEGAGYKNVLGYFHYPTNSPPTKVSDINHIIVFPNASFRGSGGSLLSGNRVQLKYWNGSSYSDIFPPGTSLGWFIVANGFRSNGTINSGAPHYYSLEQFNPESNPLLRPHNVLLFDPERMIVLTGFEDLNRSSGGDNDFNDVVFYASATPETAIQYTNLPLLKKTNDKDGDGIPDDRDEFPEDAAVAYSTHYPAKDSWHTIAFEDLWPMRGDYDMNDVVIGYNSTHYLTSRNEIVRVTDRIKPLWSGGILNVGFGYQTGLPSGSVTSVNKTSSYSDNNFAYKIGPNGTETGQSKATIMVFDNITDLGVNSLIEKPIFSMDIRFSSPVTVSQLTTPPYNPFIVINKSRGMEVHLPNYKPTDLADKKLFMTYDDKSNPALDRYYVSDNQMPWAIIIPGEFDFPPERMNIGEYYPKFLKWAESFGVEYPDWYLYKR